MRARSILSLLSLGTAISVVASSVQAQPGVALFVCRDGARVAARSPRVCAASGGVDVRATQAARQYDGGAYRGGYTTGRAATGTSLKYGAQPNGQYSTQKYGGAYNTGGYNNGGYNNGVVNNGGYNRRDGDESVRRDGRHDNGRRHDREHGDDGQGRRY